MKAVIWTLKSGFHWLAKMGIHHFPWTVPEVNPLSHFSPVTLWSYSLGFVMDTIYQEHFMALLRFYCVRVCRGICANASLCSWIYVFVCVQVHLVYLCVQVHVCGLCVQVHSCVCMCAGESVCWYVCPCVCRCMCAHMCVGECVCVQVHVCGDQRSAFGVTPQAPSISSCVLRHSHQLRTQQIG